MNYQQFNVLGVKIGAVQIPDVIVQMEEWIASRITTHYVAVTDMHSVIEAQHDATFRDVLNRADLVVPDGMPLVWLGRARGHRLKRRVYGPELLTSFCNATSAKQYRHFFYGGAPGVPSRLAEILKRRYGILVAGTYAPPFRALTTREEEAIVAEIQASSVDVLWVGLGAPKQERWMDRVKDKLKVPVLVGVGAAFDFHSGRVKQAPSWMREHGLEWLFRLIQEPRRLWRRYLVCGPEFVWYSLLELIGLKQFHSEAD